MAGTKSTAITVKAVIDRYEGDKTVLLVGPEERPVVFPTAYLPPSLDEGACLRIDIAFDQETTARAEKEASDLLRELQEKNR